MKMTCVWIVEIVKRRLAGGFVPEMDAKNGEYTAIRSFDGGRRLKCVIGSMGGICNEFGMGQKGNVNCSRCFWKKHAKISNKNKPKPLFYISDDVISK